MQSAALPPLPIDVDLLWMRHVDYRTLTTQMYGTNKRFSRLAFQVVHEKLTHWAKKILEECARGCKEDAYALVYTAQLMQQMPKEFNGQAWWQYSRSVHRRLSDLSEQQIQVVASLSFPEISYSVLRETPTAVRYLMDAHQFETVVKHKHLLPRVGEPFRQRMRSLSPDTILQTCLNLAAWGHPSQSASYILSFKDLGERQKELMWTYAACASNLLSHGKLEAAIALTSWDDLHQTQNMREESLEAYFGRRQRDNEAYIELAGIPLLTRYILSMPFEEEKKDYLFHCVKYLKRTKREPEVPTVMQHLTILPGAKKQRTQEECK